MIRELRAADTSSIERWILGPLALRARLRKLGKEGEAFVPKYLDLLAAGGSDTPENLLARMDLDIADPRFWDAAAGELFGGRRHKGV